MFKCEICSNNNRCRLPEKYTETSEICDCFEYEDTEDTENDEEHVDYENEGIEINLIFPEEFYSTI
jgi:hypothetical protein